MNIKIITGLSGAGKSTVIKSLEDLGYYCIDNLPPALIMQFIEMSSALEKPINKVALGVDIRSYAFFDNIDGMIEKIFAKYPKSEIIFLEASDQVLIKRYKETRRVHPINETGSLIDDINKEREQMARIKKMASLVIDTSNMNGRQLGHTIKMSVTKNIDFEKIAITFQSFGFKKGLPLDSDIVIDVRFLPNPYYDESLRELTGENEAVRDYIFKHYDSQLFYTKLREMIDFLLPRYIREGKNQVTISIGCTGGRHRSVALCHMLGKDYKELNYITSIKHRDMK